jgi:hypothetical protein
MRHVAFSTHVVFFLKQRAHIRHHYELCRCSVAQDRHGWHHSVKWMQRFKGKSNLVYQGGDLSQKDTKLNHSLSLYTQQWSSIVTPDNLL